MEFTEAYPSTSTVRECRRYGSGIHDGSGFRCCRSTANSSRGIARIYFLYVELTLSHHCRAWLFRSSQLANVRPARKLLSINQKGRSTRAKRLASPRSCATKRNPKRSANASISGTGIISRPGPEGAPPQHHHVRVIDHHTFDHAARPRGHPPQRVGEKYLAVESVKCRMDLEKQHPRITQDTGGGLRLVLPAAHFDGVRRRIVLHLHARLEVILARRHDRRLPDALPAAEPRQSLIGQCRAARHQLLMDPHEIPLARCQKFEDLFAIRLRFLRPLDLRHVGGVGAQHFAHGESRHPQHLCDLVFAHSLRAQFQNRGSLCLAQHVSLPAPFRFGPSSAPVPGAHFPSGLALVSVVGQSSPAALRQAAFRWGAGWRSPYPDRAPLVRPPPVWLPAPAAAFSKTTPARRECVRGPRVCRCARPY